MIHALKCWTPYWAHVVAGTKTFEVRKADRSFAVADLLVLIEVDPQGDGTTRATGRRAEVRVTYVLHDRQLLPDHVVLGVRFERVINDFTWAQAAG